LSTIALSEEQMLHRHRVHCHYSARGRLGYHGPTRFHSHRTAGRHRHHV